MHYVFVYVLILCQHCRFLYVQVAIVVNKTV